MGRGARIILATTIGLLLVGPSGALAAPGAGADAYSLLVDVELEASGLAVRVDPVARAVQEVPPGPPGVAPAQASSPSAGPHPADGSLVKSIGSQQTIASANATPAAHAASQASAVQLLVQNGTPRITADLVKAEAHAACDTAPHATGTTFTNLKVNGQAIVNPAPNTIIDLGNAKLIVNEQRPASSGRGIVVNALHVVGSASQPLFEGNLIVGHAASSVACDTAGSTGDAAPFRLTTDANQSTVSRGDEVTYTVTLQTYSTCTLRALTLHAPPGFEYVSTSGAFGTSEDDEGARPNGGAEVSVGDGYTLDNFGAYTQTFVLRATESAPAGLAFVNPEIRCADAGNFMQGLAAPVTVDIGPPDTTIDRAPSARIAERTAEFAFSATEEATFECSLDGAAFEPCVSPRRYEGLAEGAHTFRVRATDTLGKVDPTPAEHAFTVDLTPPEPAEPVDSTPPPAPVLTSAPAAVTIATDATFAWTGEAGGSFLCAIDGAAEAVCASPLSRTAIGIGKHTFVVRQVDAAGNAGSAATHAWEVVPDALPPAACSGRQILLTDVHREGRRIRVWGVARLDLRGQRAEIGLVGAPPAAAVIIGSDGVFTASLPAPSRRAAKKARYVAVAGGQRTQALKLTRRLVIVSRESVTGGVRVRARIAGVRRRTRVQIRRRLSCTEQHSAGTVRTDRRGRFSVTLPRPQVAGALAFYTAAATMRGGRTYSLPVVVGTSGS